MPREAKPEDYGHADHGQLVPAIPAKGGTNDLSRWAAFGGTLERPAPPAPMRKFDLYGPIPGLPPLLGAVFRADGSIVRGEG